MCTKGFHRFICAVFLIVSAITLVAVVSWAGKPERVIYGFTGGGDGGYPDSDLVVDSSGNIYGTAVEGGDFDSGVVFKLVPTGNSWKETVLYSFTGGADGAEPYGGVTLDSQGNLYGTAVVGGTGGSCIESGCGVVFKLTNSAGIWTETVIHNFTGGKDGYGPGSGLTFDHAGNLYGTTPTGGADGLGVIYQLTPQQNGAWILNVIHTFTGGADGGTGSAGRLIFDADGNLYGVATVGGVNGSGTAYELKANLNGSWKFMTLYAFKGQPDAGFPYGGLVLDGSGNLYGTSYYDGANDVGAVYRLLRGNGSWTETVLYSFRGTGDGSGPISTLIFDVAGNLYGTTSESGAVGCNCGTIFKLTPSGNGEWTGSVAYRFQGAPDGAFAYNGLVADSKGNFYGPTVRGGTDNEGAIYRFTPQ